MSNKARLGKNPLNWIQDSREEDSKQSKQSNSSKQSNEDNMSKQSNLSKQSNQDLQSKQSKTDLPKAEKPNSTHAGLPQGWQRATFIVKTEYLEQLKAVAYWERKEIKVVIEEAILGYLGKKDVKTIPK